VPIFGERTKIIGKLCKPKSVASSLYPSIVTGVLGQGQDLTEQSHVIQQVDIYKHTCLYQYLKL
jgi:hypothetical protein